MENNRNEEVLIFTEKLQKKASEYNDEIARLLSCQISELPAGLFGMIFNTLTLKLELLECYYNIWSKLTQANCLLIDENRKQNAERVLLIQKMTFISIMSSIEFCFKEYIKNFPNKIGDCKNSKEIIFLSKIIKNSKNKFVITNNDFEKWQGLIKLRNVLVHNNAIAERTEKYEYPNCILLFESGKMIKGDLKLFPCLLNQLLDLSKEWILKINSNRKRWISEKNI